MSETQSQQAGDAQQGGEQQAQQEQQAETFTQADIDRLVGKARTEERRKASEKYADYDDLRDKASTIPTLEERVATMENETRTARAEATRARIAAEFGIDTKAPADGEPSDADLILTGADEATMRAQGERFAARTSERKQYGNHVPGEGTNPPTKPDPTRSFLRELTGKET